MGTSAEEFERACAALYVPSERARAEEFLLGLRRSAAAPEVAWKVLCTQEASLEAKFHASQTLRHSTVNQWPLLDAQQRVRLREMLFSLLDSISGSGRNISHLQNSSNGGVGSIYSLNYSQENPILMRSIWKELVHALALMCKRGWFDDELQKHKMFEKARTWLELRQGDAPELRHLIGLGLLDALVDEFSSSKASAIGVSFSFHWKCHYAFEREGLLESFVLGANVLKSLAESNFASLKQSKIAAETVRSCLSLCSDCLSWSFGSEDASAEWAFELASALARSEDAQVTPPERIRPGSAWREALLTNDLVTTLFRLYSSSRSASVGHAGTGEDDIAHMVRQVLLLLASLNGKVFASRTEKAAFIHTLFEGSLFGALANPLVPMHVAAGLSQTFSSTAANSAEAYSAAGGAEYLDFSAFLARIMANFSVEDMVLLPKGKLEASINAIYHLSVNLLDGAVLNASKAATERRTDQHEEDEDIDRSWLMEAFDHTLEVWSTFASWTESNESNNHQGSAEQLAAHNLFKVQCAQLFTVYVEKRLAIARSAIEREENANFDEDNQVEDITSLEDHLQGIAIVGRAQPEVCVPAMIQAFESTFERLKAYTKGQFNNYNEGAKVAEELFWLVSLSGCLLADPVEGEKPMIPVCLLKYSKDFCNSKPTNSMSVETAMQDPLVKLSWCLLHLLEFESVRVRTSAGTDENVSPCLSGRLLSSLTRWSNSYLMPERDLYKRRTNSSIQDSLPTSIEMCFSSEAQATQLIEFLVRASSIYLSNWGIESDVNPRALALLNAIVENSSCRELLQEMSSWSELCRAHVDSVCDEFWRPLNGLTAIGHGALVDILLKSLQVNREAPEETLKAAELVFEQLVAPIKNRMSQLASSRLEKNLANPQIVQELDRMYYMHAGIVCASMTGPLARWCRSFVLQVLPREWSEMSAVGLKCIEKGNLASSTCAAARGLISNHLEMVRLFSVEQLTLTPESQLQPAFQIFQHILGVYDELCRVLRNSTTTRGADFMSEEDWAQDVKALLQILCNVAERDQLDFSEPVAPHPVNGVGSGQQSLTSSDVVFRGIDLVFPLISNELLQYPGLAQEFFKLLSIIVDVYPENVANLNASLFVPVVKALEFGMVDHRVDVSRKSFEAISCLAEFHVDQRTRGKVGLGKNINGDGGSVSIFLQILQQVFSFVIFQTFDASLLNSAANAMFALIAAEKDDFFAMISQVIANQQDELTRQRLRQAFEILVSSNGIEFNLTMTNRRKFQANLLNFVNDVRGFMCQK